MRNCFGSWMRSSLFWFVACQLSAGPFLSTACRSTEAWDPPPTLRDTGLYSDFSSHTIAPGNLPYEPQYPLWSDGATKRRWIHLPAGSAIDASNPDTWSFPVGTKLWKEFSFAGHRVETRLMEAVGEGKWRFSTYVWNEAESEAPLVPASGMRGVVEIRPGIGFDIPGILDCRACHDSNRTEVLGFSALQLSSDRDPGAPHGGKLSPGMITLKTLIDRKLIRSFPPEWAKRPLRIFTSNPVERSAIGYLHANCGNCHNPNNTDLARFGLILRHSVAPGAASEPAIVTGVGHAGNYQIPGTDVKAAQFILPGDASHSAVWYRMATRNPFQQMPALGTKIVDEEATALVKRWIDQVLPERKNVPEPDRSGKSTQ
jgi:hypothetical protein